MIIEGSEVVRDLRERCDVCVIGSGAGGAVMAKELAEKGLSVIVLEEGGYYRNTEFSTDALRQMKTLYRDIGWTTALGTPAIPIPLGRCVGGTTVINMGTCFRAPEKVLRSWVEKGLADFSSEALAPYYDMVEGFINVQTPGDEILGGNARTIRRGAEALGLEAKPLRRNIFNCKGCGTCSTGCLEGAKQSMDVSYIPWAVDLGARVFADCRAEELLMYEGAPVGVGASILDRETKQKKASLVVDARAVVVAAGALHSPAFLLRNKVGGKPVGRGLKVHLASRVGAFFPEEIQGWKGIGQSVFIDDYMDERIILEATFVPPPAEAPGVPGIGREFWENMSRYRNMAQLGVMVSDLSTGRVRAKGRRPFAFYRTRKADAAAMLKGIGYAARIMLAAGAERVLLPFRQLHYLEKGEDVSRLPKRVRAADIEMAAFHPMGSCRLGTSPKDSVVSPEFEVHGTRNLFVADGSVIPTSLGVNPQLTIMALATKAAEGIAKRLL